MQTVNAYLEAMMPAVALAQRLDEVEHLIDHGYEASPAVCGPDDWIQSHTIDGQSLELVKPRQPKLPPHQAVTARPHAVITIEISACRFEAWCVPRQ